MTSTSIPLSIHVDATPAMHATEYVNSEPVLLVAHRDVGHGVVERIVAALQLDLG